MKKKVNKKLIIVVSLVLIIGGLMNVCAHADVSFKQLFAKELAAVVGPIISNQLGLADLSGGELSLGSAYSEAQNDMATSTQDLSDHGGLSIFDRLRFGDEPATDSNSVTYKYLFKDFASASSTVFDVKNEEGQTVYVQRIGLKLEGLATTTSQLFVGTTTDGYVNLTTQLAVTDPDGAITTLMDNVLVTDLSVVDATNTMLWSESFVANDSGYGTAIKGIPVLAGQHITGFASSTDADRDGAEITTGDFDGEVFIEYLIEK